MVIKKGKSVKKKATSQLWSKLFEPQDYEDVFAKTEYSELRDWISAWRERLEKQQILDNGELTRKRKKKRKPAANLETEDEEENYEVEYAELPENPLVLYGPTSCGKTTMVNF